MFKDRDSDSENYTSSCYTSSSSEDACETHGINKAGAAASLGKHKAITIIPRPAASSGYWLCLLLPLACGTQYLNTQTCETTIPAHKLLTVAAIGTCIQSYCFFIYLFFDTGIIVKMIISLGPGIVTSALYNLILHKPWWFSAMVGFGVTLLYQSVYIRIMKGLPRCFTFGEAAILVQGLILFAINAVNNVYHALFVAPVEYTDEFQQLNIIMMNGLLWLLIISYMQALMSYLRQALIFYVLLAVLLVAVTCSPVTQPLPIMALLNFILRDNKRLYIIGFYLLLVGLTIGTVSWQLGNSSKANTRIRKIFHLLIVLVYMPGLLFQCAFLYIATGVALAMFTMLELMRILEVPPLANRLKDAFAAFRDEKDSGLLALTPFCLLIGCSMPIWFSSCPCSKTDGSNLLPLLSGILTVGFGDTAASVIGSKFGRNKWRNSSRTLEGTLGFFIAVLLAIYCLNSIGYLPMTQVKWFVSILATISTALIEAMADQIDNLVLPLVFFIIVSLT